MTVTCSNCGNAFVPDDSQVFLIETLRASGATFGMLSCSSCGLGFPVNPQDVSAPYVADEELTWRSPIPGSHGLVSYIENDDEASFYGCSETGAVWFTREAFHRDIEAVIRKYPHRSGFYRKVNNRWYPVAEEPENIEELIDSEEVEDIDSYRR